MNKNMKQVFEDLENLDLPKYISAWDKLKCTLINGMRIFWYYKDDVKFAKEIHENVKELKNHSGIIIAADETIYNGSLDEEHCIVVIDRYPVEKEYPEITWIALNRLVDDDNLIEIYT